MTDYRDPPAASQPTQLRLQTLISGLNRAVCPQNTIHIGTEWHDETPTRVQGALFLSSVHERLSFEITNKDDDQTIRQKMADTVFEAGLDVLARREWEATRKSQFGLCLISSIHLQMLRNAGVDPAQYAEWIEGNRWCHHPPADTNSDYFTLPNINGAMDRMDNMLGYISTDSRGRMKLQGTVYLAGNHTIQIEQKTEVMVFAQIPETIREGAVGRKLTDLVEIPSITGAECIIEKIESVPASKMRPESNYILVTDPYSYVSGEIHSSELREAYINRLREWVNR